MDKLFRVDGKFYTVMGKVFDLVLICVLWIIGCIPVVTILTSTSSMYHAVVKCVRYDRGSAFGDFKDAYRKNLRQGVVLTLLYGGLGALLAYADYQVFAVSDSRTSVMLAASLGLIVLSALFMLNLLWMIPVFSRFSNSLGNLIRLSYVISIRHLLRGILLVFILAAAVIVFLAINEVILILPAVVMLLFSCLSEPVLHRYMPKQEENNGDWRYGFE